MLPQTKLRVICVSGRKGKTRRRVSGVSRRRGHSFRKGGAEDAEEGSGRQESRWRQEDRQEEVANEKARRFLRRAFPFRPLLPSNF